MTEYEHTRLDRLARSLRRRMPAFMEVGDLVAAGWLGLRAGGWVRARGAMLDEIRCWYGNGRRNWEGDRRLPAQQVQLPRRPHPDADLPAWEEIADEPATWYTPRLRVDLSPLPKGERDVMELLLEGQPIADVAARVGRTPNAVMIARTRAVKRLRAAA